MHSPVLGDITITPVANCFVYRLGKTLPILPLLAFWFPHVLTTLTTFSVLLRIIIDIPPRLRKLHNHFFCMPSPLNYYFLFTCLVFLVKSDQVYDWT